MLDNSIRSKTKVIFIFNGMSSQKLYLLPVDNVFLQKTVKEFLDGIKIWVGN